MLDQDQEIIKFKYNYDTIKSENEMLLGRINANETKFSLTEDT